ncbi:MAG: SDR family oxidoreductase [Betaproteobacteria bacterium]|nr:SDR family oxidoreductase [Betaproteobacteria bacterium]
MKVAVISGGNRGLGLEIGRQLLAEGVSLMLGSRDVEKGRRAAQQLLSTVKPDTAEVHVAALDVADSQSVAAFAAETANYYGQCDILINNAGIMPEARDGSLMQTSPEQFLEIFDINVVGSVRLCQAFVPMMKKRGYGRIVNLSSGLGQLERMGAGLPGYRLSKTALNALTRTLAAELNGSGILVNAVSPGWVKTEMGGPNADRTVEEGAETATWLALLPSTGPTGGFFRDKKAIIW